MKSTKKLLLFFSIQVLLLGFSTSSFAAAGKTGGSMPSRGGGADDTGFATDLVGFRDDRTATQAGQYPYALGIYDVKLGYVLSNGLYFGGFYTTLSNTPGFSGLASVDTMTGYGAAIGFRKFGFVIDGAYYISSTFTLPSNVTYSQGSSMQGYLGYAHHIGGGLNIGFGYAYRSFGYTQQTTNGISASQNITLTYGHPSLSIGFQF
jgi:hypothetical protein